ncbi:MAG TPA: hypothetical protein PK256_21330, partial [Verrucomicrobiota bacterium]|nr:hypothetical protein [Verrucomicrobiota bacterium]
MSKPKLLVLELWRVGDLAMASPFLRQATRRYEVTLVAQPMACEFQRRFWPEVRVIPFEAPWTVFLGKYRLHKWPWAELGCLMRNLRRQEFDCSVSARWDPRDHFVLWLSGAQERIGFPRVGSGFFLSRRLSRPPPHVHRYDLWKRVGAELGLELPSRQEMPMPALRSGGRIVVHTGAGAPVRVWPLERWRDLIIRLRERGAEITILSDPIQRDTWLAWGE